MNTHKNKKRSVLLAIGLISCLSAIAFAWSKKEDFQEAARSSGCGLIPYSSENSSCRDNYAKQREWCTGDRELGCSDLKKDNPSDRELAKTRRDNAKECLEHRRYVRKIFDDAASRLRDEDDPSDAEIKALAQKIIDKIQEGRSGHEDAMRDTERRRDKCDDVYNGR